jgi:hypothetical protein
MTDFDKDIYYLLKTARDAVKVLRGNAEYFEAQGKDAKAERDAVRWLSLAIQLVEHDRYATEETGNGSTRERVKL